MKYFAVALVASSVMGQKCSEENGYVCDDGGSCMFRYVGYVGDPANAGYTAELANDPTLTAGQDTHICTPSSEVDNLLNLNGRKDPKTTVTAYYELRGDGADSFYAKKQARLSGSSAHKFTL